MLDMTPKGWFSTIHDKRKEKNFFFRNFIFMTGKTPKWLNSVAYAKKGFFELNRSDMKTQMLNLLYTWQTF